MASSSDYQIRAVVNSTVDPDVTDTSQFIGTFGVWQDLSSDRSWSIQIDTTDPAGNYLKNFDFEIRNKHTQEIVATTSGDFILNIVAPNASTNGPYYSLTSPKFFWRAFTTDEVYWNDVAVFSGDFPTDATSIVSGGWKYYKDAYVTAGSGGGLYQVRRETTTELNTPSYPPPPPPASSSPTYIAGTTYWQDGPYGDNIYFDGVQVFGGDSTSLNGVTQKDVGTWRYTRVSFVTSNPGGSFYQVARDWIG